MRSLPLLIAALAAVTAPVCAAIVHRPPPPVFITASVAEDAQHAMPPGLWKRLVADYVGGRAVAIEDGSVPVDAARCRAQHASYAVAATFERIPYLPGLGEDARRVYAIARFTVRNCASGVLGRTHAVLLHSDPPESGPTDLESVAERMWLRAALAELARVPLSLVTPAVTPAPSATPAPSEAPAPSDRPIPSPSASPDGTRATPAASPASSAG